MSGCPGGGGIGWPRPSTEEELGPMARMQVSSSHPPPPATQGSCPRGIFAGGTVSIPPAAIRSRGKSKLALRTHLRSSLSPASGLTSSVPGIRRPCSSWLPRAFPPLHLPVWEPSAQSTLPTMTFTAHSSSSVKISSATSSRKPSWSSSGCLRADQALSWGQGYSLSHSAACLSMCLGSSGQGPRHFPCTPVQHRGDLPSDRWVEE